MNRQFQLDALGEVLQLLAAAARLDRLDRRRLAGREIAVAAIEERWTKPDAGLWELDDQQWTHPGWPAWPAAGYRGRGRRAARRPGHRQAAAGPGWPTRSWPASADAVHPTGRWQRAPDDERVDAALLLPLIRGARRAGRSADRRHHRGPSSRAQRRRLRLPVPAGRRPLHEAEGAFLLCGLWMARRRTPAATRRGRAWFERSRAACGPAGIYTEEFDVHQRQLAATCRRRSCTPACWRPPSGCSAQLMTARSDRPSDSSKKRSGSTNMTQCRDHRGQRGIGRRLRSCSGAGRRTCAAGPRTLGLDGARPMYARPGDRRTVQPDVADPPQVDSAASQAEQAFGPIECGSTSRSLRCSPLHRDHCGGVPARHRGVLPGLRVRDDGRRWTAWTAATTGRSSRSGSALCDRSIRSSPPTAAQSTPSTGSPSRCVASSCTTGGRVHITVVQMPAVNTPQFSWVRSRLPRHPQPVPPIYEPEVAARGVLLCRGSPAASSTGSGAAGRDAAGPEVRRPAAGPLPGPHRLRQPADRRAGQPRPAGQPVGAGGQGRHRPRRARRL